MAETGFHVTAILMLYQLLLEFFTDRPDVLVMANQFWYWEKGNPKARLAPDVVIIPGVGREPPRRSYRMWLEGNTRPAAVFEISSKKTIQNDLGSKLQQYERLGVHEYFLFDPDARVLSLALQGFRLADGRYDRISPADDALDSDLGFRVRIEGKILRLSDLRTNQPVLFPTELAEQERRRAEQARQQAEQARQQAEQARQQAEQARQQAEQEHHRAEQERRQAEQERRRAEQLEAELQRLRQMLDGGEGSGA
jgi:Uma2 family endonuclease